MFGYFKRLLFAKVIYGELLKLLGDYGVSVKMAGKVVSRANLARLLTFRIDKVLKKHGRINRDKTIKG